MTEFSQKVRATVRERAKERCEVCGCWLREGEGEYHHRSPRGAGGRKETWVGLAANALLLCQLCHISVERNRRRALELGLLVSRIGIRTAEETPVRYRDGLFYLLDNQGEKRRVEE